MRECCSMMRQSLAERGTPVNPRKTKPEPDFEIRILKKYPEDIPVHAVADVIQAVQSLLQAGISKGADEEDLRLHLLDIQRGSAVYRCLSNYPEQAGPYLRVLGSKIDDSQSDTALGTGLVHIKALSEIAKAAESDIEVTQDKGRTVLLRIVPDTYDRLKMAHTVSGQTVLVGELKRVGGATSPRCMVRAINQAAAIYCDLTHDQARELAPRLYETVVLEGDAVWLKTSLEIVEFRVERIVRFTQKGFAEAKKELREAGADRWDHVSPSELEEVAS